MRFGTSTMTKIITFDLLCCSCVSSYGGINGVNLESAVSKITLTKEPTSPLAMVDT